MKVNVASLQSNHTDRECVGPPGRGRYPSSSACDRTTGQVFFFLLLLHLMRVQVHSSLVQFRENGSVLLFIDSQ